MKILKELLDNGAKIAFYGRLVYNYDFIHRFFDRDIDEIIKESGKDNLKYLLSDIDVDVFMDSSVPKELVKSFAKSKNKQGELRELCKDLFFGIPGRLIDETRIEEGIDYNAGYPDRNINTLPVHLGGPTIDSILLYGTVFPNDSFLINSYKNNMEFNPVGDDSYLEKAYDRFMRKYSNHGTLHKQVLRNAFIGSTIASKLHDASLKSFCSDLREGIYGLIDKDYSKYTSFFQMPEEDVRVILDELDARIRSSFKS